FGNHVVAIKPEAAGQSKPALDSAFLCVLPRGVTVVVDQPAAPIAPQIGVMAARQQAGVLDRDHRLVIVAVERPGLDLSLGATSAMQEPMERLQAVIAVRAEFPQFRCAFAL